MTERQPPGAASPDDDGERLDEVISSWMDGEAPSDDLGAVLAVSFDDPPAPEDPDVQTRLLRLTTARAALGSPAEPPAAEVVEAQIARALGHLGATTGVPDLAARRARRAPRRPGANTLAVAAAFVLATIGLVAVFDFDERADQDAAIDVVDDADDSSVATLDTDTEATGEADADAVGSSDASDVTDDEALESAMTDRTADGAGSSELSGVDQAADDADEVETTDQADAAAETDDAAGADVETEIAAEATASVDDLVDTCVDRLAAELDVDVADADARPVLTDDGDLRLRGVDADGEDVDIVVDPSSCGEAQRLDALITPG